MFKYKEWQLCYVPFTLEIVCQSWEWCHTEVDRVEVEKSENQLKTHKKQYFAQITP